VLDRIFAAWLDEAVLIEGYLPDALRTLDADLSHQWMWDGNDHVDPQKEANAQSTRLTNHTTTLAHEYARQGRDWEAELRQRAREISLMRELGLPTTTAQPAPTSEPEPEEEEQDAPVGNQE
jgi:capsid protein